MTHHLARPDGVCMHRRPDAAPTTFQNLQRRSARRTPCQKKRYRTESEALDAAKQLRRHGYDGQRAYPCTTRNCGGWHLTTQPEFASWTICRYLATTTW